MKIKVNVSMVKSVIILTQTGCAWSIQRKGIVLISPGAENTCFSWEPNRRCKFEEKCHFRHPERKEQKLSFFKKQPDPAANSHHWKLNWQNQSQILEHHHRFPQLQMTDIDEIWNHFELIYKHPKNISRKFENGSSPRTGVITDYLISVGNWGNEQTDRHTRILKLFGTNVETSQECLRKIWES